MNSYPIELLGQHAPLMFVAGLSEGPSSPPMPSSPPPLARPPVAATSPTQATAPELLASNARQDQFTILTTRLRAALTTKGKGVVWDPNRARSFQVVLVDKGVRLPPRKIQAPPNAAGQPSGPPHSPLSPLTPSSPLHPDGLIAPIWVRKHIELVPCVFVLFLRLFELPPPKSPLDARDGSERDEERKRDADLSAEIAARKKSTGERNIKLTVVLLASRRMLDDPFLDTRLSFIRRQSGLDSRAALFVLSPVTSAELADFVKSLQSALFEAGMEYYTAHSKRVRRKRGRHTHTGSTGPNAMLQGAGGSAIGRPLREIGWAVRYEYKLALFAEFRAEQEVSRKHYEDCWLTLVDMLGSTAILPPRTKRWAEAKVLADCIAIKICKLYLYSNEHGLALAYFNRHLHKFAELSRGWGIGEETFEFWSWMARQYRIFSELLEVAIRWGMKLPKLGLPPAAEENAVLSPQTQAYAQMAGDIERQFGLNPANTLQHPGYYYYAAATCTQQRYERFLGALEHETARPGVISQSPGFLNEKKVEHHTIIVELYTKAYELFKKYRVGQSRQTFYIAYRIAETYHAAGKYESAVRFFERIAKTYRRERWGHMLRPILSMWYECCRQLGEVETTLKLLVEMLTPGATKDEEERAVVEGDLVALLQNSEPTSPESGHIVADISESEPIFSSAVLFWRPEVFVDELAPFQIQVTSPTDVSLYSIPFAVLKIYFSGEEEEEVVISVVHRASEEVPQVHRVDLGNLELEDLSSTSPREVIGDLRWPIGGTKAFCGSLSSRVARELRVTKLVLIIRQGSWHIEMPFNPSPVQDGLPRLGPAAQSKWLCTLGSKDDQGPQWIPMYRLGCFTTVVKPKPHLLQVELEHQSPAHLNEKYPVEVCVTNADGRDFDIIMDVLLHPSEDEGSANRMFLDEHESTSLIKGVSLGVIKPGATAKKTLYLASKGGEGDRVMDISITSRTVSDSPDGGSALSDTAAADEDGEVEKESTSQDTSETLKTLSIPVTQPFASTAQAMYHRTRGPMRPLLDLEPFEEGVFRPDVTATLVANISNASPWDLEVLALKWNRLEEEILSARLLDTSLQQVADEFPFTWKTGDQYAIVSRFEMSLEVDEPGTAVACPGEIELSWRRKGSQHIASSTIRLPALRPPDDGLIGIINAPPTAVLHRPFMFTLQVQNRHLSHTADIILQSEASEAFVTAGPRNCRLPTLLPDSSIEAKFNIVPIQCGNVKLPNFKVFDQRKPFVPGSLAASDEDDEAGTSTVVLRPIKVVDQRWDARNEGGMDLPLHVVGEGGRSERMRNGVSVLVLPA